MLELVQILFVLNCSPVMVGEALNQCDNSCIKKCCSFSFHFGPFLRIDGKEASRCKEKKQRLDLNVFAYVSRSN